MSDVTKRDVEVEDVIILRSVFGKVGIKYFIMPCPDPRTNRFPDCVKKVNSHNDMILTDDERNSGQYFIKETESFTVEDGTTFNLRVPEEKARWEAIKFCPLIAKERFEKDSKGNYVIDGTSDMKTRKPRYGTAELYIDRPGVEAVRRVSKKRLIVNACNYIMNDPRGVEGRLLIARLLGKNMRNAPDADVEDYLLQVAEKDPNRIINLYTGDDTDLRILFIEAKEKKVIYVKDKLYLYADNVVLGATDDAVLTWMKDSKNYKTLELIKKDTYPDLYIDNAVESGDTASTNSKKGK